MKKRLINTVFNVQLSRANNGKWYLNIDDDSSTLNVMEFILTSEQFSKLMSTQYVRVEGKILIDDAIGMNKEFVNRPIDIKESEYGNLDLFYDRISPEVEVDGWKIEKDSNWNLHNSAVGINKRTYTVRLYRYMPKD